MDLLQTKTPKPAERTVQTEIGAVTLVYDQRAMLPAVTSGYTPIRERLSKVLLAWDVTNDGEPMQPPALTDETVWIETVTKARGMALELWDQDHSARQILEPAALAKLPPAQPKPEPVDAPVTFQHMRDAYTAAWTLILGQLPIDFLRDIDKEICDHFLGGGWREPTLPTTLYTATSTNTNQKNGTTALLNA